MWKGSVASREWFQPGEWQPECLKPNESQTPTGILDPVMHLCTPELSLNRDLLSNPIGGHLKSSIPKKESGTPISLTGLTLESLYRSDILSSTNNIRQFSARLGGADCTSHFFQFPVSNPCLAHLAPFQPCSKIFKMFFEFIINRHLRPKQCLFQHKDINSQSAMQPQRSGQQPFNLAVPLLRSHEWKLNLTHTALCPYAFLSRLQL